MIKCPNCEKPAGANFIDTQVYVWRDVISVYVTYQCECGCKFTTRSQMDREAHEKMYREEKWGE